MIGIGCDIVDSSRFEKICGEKNFLSRAFTENEMKIFKECGFKAETVAGRFAAKEAFAKACGTGFAKFALNEISVEKEISGQPKIVLAGGALDFFKNLGGRKIFVSISHDKGMAMSVVALDD